MSDFTFPTEVIDLPSKGKMYPPAHPLAGGTVDVKYMTAKEEDILTSTNLIQKGVVIDKLMESLIVTKGVKPDDLLIGDLNAVMVAARILAYGKDYEIQTSCNSCGKKFDHTIDLTQLNTVSPDVEPVNGEFTLTLPTGVIITFKLLTRADEKAIKAEVDGLKKINNSVDADVSTRLKYIITSVNGDRDKKTIREFADRMIVRDSRALRDEIKKVSPDVDFNVEAQCQYCEAPAKLRMPFGANFFWPDL
jgi:hypothetical protein